MTLPPSASWEPIEKPVVLNNLQCAYCGCSPRKLTVDHVIARNFVPKGSFLANDWNLFVNACEPCNNKKSALENEISALTLQPGVGEHHSDAAVADIARRKAAKVRSKASGRLVKDSHVSAKLDGRLAPDVSLSFDFVGPPQLAPDSVMRLADSQLQAFFYLTTYDESSRTGSLRPPIRWWHFTRRTDWGSQLLTSFADETRTWLPRIHGYAAKGNYRIAVKRKDAATNLWSFALEWNRSVRVVGTFGDEDDSERFVASLSFDSMSERRPGERYREEVALQRAENDLFESVHL